MNDDKRGLGRGLDDLMAQNEIDLPFLSTYGPASDVEDDISQAKSPPEEIFDAVLRHLRSLQLNFDNNQEREIQIYGLAVKIEDNGSGIKKNELSKIFLPFFSTKKRGSGIGLYLVKRIINLHDGRISVSCIDNLTSFRIKFPL